LRIAFLFVFTSGFYCGIPKPEFQDEFGDECFLQGYRLEGMYDPAFTENNPQLLKDWLENEG